MVLKAEQLIERRKRKRQSESAYTLVHRSLHHADGTVHLKSYRQLPQVNTSMGRNVLDLAEIPISLLRASNVAQRNLVKHTRPQYLRDVSSLEEFRSIFIQALRCHRLVYMKTGDLHGNLSPNKITFTRDGDGAPVGCLDDWDPAKPALVDETSTAFATGHHAGEAPFMAIDLLRDKPPTHLYRHDLESSLYILIWCALHLNLNGPEVPSINETLVGWANGTWTTIRSQKDQLFSSDYALYRKSINDAITPAFRPLERWIRGLIFMFDDGYKARMTRSEKLQRLEYADEQETPDAWNEDTMNGNITYEKFMAAIGESPHLDI